MPLACTLNDCVELRAQATYPPFVVGGVAAVSEVHLRRLDRSDRLHRRAVAVVSIDATPEEASLCRRGALSVPSDCKPMWSVEVTRWPAPKVPSVLSGNCRQLNKHEGVCKVANAAPADNHRHSRCGLPTDKRSLAAGVGRANRL